MLRRFDEDNPRFNRDLAFTIIHWLAQAKIISARRFLYLQLNMKVFRPHKDDF